jgi:DNA-binding transcriptional ArsR family regulator
MTSLRQTVDEEADVWRALANPIRRRLLDLLRDGPRTTGDLADELADLSRFAVMQHLGVLTGAGLVRVRRRGRYRYNHLDPVPLRRWYERWVVPLADDAGAEILALERAVERTGGAQMPDKTDAFRTVRIASELRFDATPERVFEVLAHRSMEWFPYTYGGERVETVVVEPFVGGRHFEDWGNGGGHLYGHVTVYDPPHHLAYRGRIMAGTILDTEYEIEADESQTILRMEKVAVGPMGEDEAAGIAKMGDIGGFEEELRAVIEG